MSQSSSLMILKQVSIGFEGIISSKIVLAHKIRVILDSKKASYHCMIGKTEKFT